MTNPIRTDAAATRIAERQPFRTHGELSADTVDASSATRIGRLPRDLEALWRADWKASHGQMYAVWSYSTPIAWWTPRHGWRIPDETYSITTATRHRPQLRLITAEARRALAA
ncbi:MULTISPECIES: hypothetical protein [Nocardia]|uniref:hypothetical protein n=1 Tax=Nocardia TaxID=1817 RepID=UPI0024546BF9|nr:MULTISPECIES: hypothetical protein [Nocardia]